MMQHCEAVICARVSLSCRLQAALPERKCAGNTCLVPFGSQTVFTFHLILTHKLNNHIKVQGNQRVEFSEGRT